jgi:hypothetical protein
MKYRKLRIAWSVGCGALAVLLVALWVRSYSWMDFIVGPDTYRTRVVVGSFEGWISALWGGPPRGVKTWRLDHQSKSVTHGAQITAIRAGIPTPAPAFGIRPSPFGGTSLMLPHWFAALTFVTLAVVTFPWTSLHHIRWRFSLFGFLAAVTIIALLLGLIIAVMNGPDMRVLL